MIPPVRAAQSVYGSDGLGPIVFATPELGKWSTFAFPVFGKVKFSQPKTGPIGTL